ncbi:MAG: DNA polymerase IV [Hornefia sp.]|nr:DNA polymerase IV [Hornefia sp.]
MDKVILHCDVNSFYASVELLEHPDLADKPVAVSGSSDNRHGIILAKNEAAKRYGIVTAETIWQATKKCPGLVLLPPHHRKYREFSVKLNKIYHQYTNLIEPFSVDESWLDVTASRKLFGSGEDIANTIRERVRHELGLSLSIGVSFNKIFAKMGSEYRKPDATTVITRENYKRLLWPLSVNQLFFVGYATSEKLKSCGIMTIGDLANSNEMKIKELLGNQGLVLRSYARGEDNSAVKDFDQRDKIKSVGNGMTFRRNISSREDISIGLSHLAGTVAGRLRKYGLKAYGVKVDIKDPNFKVISRQTQLDTATNLAEEIRKTALDIVKKYRSEGSEIRLLTVTAINLVDEKESEQLSIFDNFGKSRRKSESLERTMDEIKNKFGNEAIDYANIIGNDIGIDY